MRSKRKRKRNRLSCKRLQSLRIVCRCEDITEDEIRDVIRAGYHSLEEVKRILRTGMGHCGGRGCLKVVARLIEEETGIPITRQEFPVSRPPLKPVSLGQLGLTTHEQ